MKHAYNAFFYQSFNVGMSSRLSVNLLQYNIIKLYLFAYISNFLQCVYTVVESFGNSQLSHIVRLYQNVIQATYIVHYKLRK